MEKVLIFGHKKPDSDSICSAIALCELKKKQGFENYIAKRLGDLSNETSFILEHFGVKTPEFIDEIKEDKQKVVLVDHNERKQSINGIEKATIIQIVDHHRFSDLHTEEPLFIRSEPVGCTSTIIYKMYKESGIVPDKNIAGVMLSAIISDTLLFNSPTCTNDDIKAGEELSKIAEVDKVVYGKEMLEKGASVKGLTPSEIIEVDNKHFDINEENTVSIAQINTVDLEELMSKKDSFIEAMNNYCSKNNTNSMIFMITDILKNGSQLIVCGKDNQMIKEAFGIVDDEVFLDGVVSRKKQIVPKL